MNEEQIKILIIVIAIVVVLIALFIIVNRFVKTKKKKEGNSLCENIILYLGNKDNIVSLESKGSRLVAVLKDNSKLAEDELKNLGVTSIMKMSNKITLVIGSISSEVVNYFNNQ